MKKGVLLAILSVVLVAGCVQGQLPSWIQQTTTVVGGAGLVITEFAADPTEIYTDASGRIMVTISNKGGAVVDSGDAVFYLTGSGIKDDLANTLYWSGRGTTSSVFAGLTKTLNPEDPVRGTPAGEQTITYSLTSPTGIAKGTTRNDIFIGRLYYDYSTTVSGNVWVYSEAESDAARASDRSLNSATLSSTAGPVALYVKAIPDPVVLASGEDTFTLQIKISNVGGGTLYEAGAIDYSDSAPDLSLDAETELNTVEIDIEGSGLTGFADCEGVQELVAGKDITLSCDVTVTSPPTTMQSYQLSVTATYGYFTERTATVSVSGR
jgi:hypothetical protein